MSGRRVTLKDPWVLNGDGDWRDLITLNPFVKLTLDLIIYLVYKRPLHTALIILGIFNPTLAILCLITILHIKQQYAKYQQQKVIQSYTKTSDPTVPLDQSLNPLSALSLKRHVLIGGDSGTGKSNAVWSIIQSLTTYNFNFKLHVIDPAGGVELSLLEDAPFTEQYVNRPSQADELINEFKDKMDERLSLLKELNLREFNPTKHPRLKNEHWHYLVIDELLLCGQQITMGALSPLGEVLAVGRKAGYIVIACTQLGQKSTLGDLRDLFPQRVCFGTRTSEMTDAVLGSQATQLGAECHKITNSQVGTGYLWTDKSNRYFKFRTPHITQEQVKHLTTPLNPSNPSNQKYATQELYSADGTLLYVGTQSPSPAPIWADHIDHSKSQTKHHPSPAKANQYVKYVKQTKKPLW